MASGIGLYVVMGSWTLSLFFLILETGFPLKAFTVLRELFFVIGCAFVICKAVELLFVFTDYINTASFLLDAEFD